VTSDQQPGSDRAAAPAGGSASIAPGAMRVGDTERNSALEALGEHLSAGRITLDEYGDRSAKVTVAKTADDLSALFDDLPAPHPVLPGTAVTGIVSQTASGGVARYPHAAEMPPARGVARPDGDTRSTAQKLVAAAAAASVFVAVALFFVTGHWWWFLLIPAISAVAGSIWGPDWKEPRPAVGPGDARRQLRDDHRRELRDRHRDRRRELRGRDRFRP
jgi:hypothetical protein